MSKINNQSTKPVQPQPKNEKPGETEKPAERLTFNRVVKTLSGAMSYVGLTRQGPQTQESSPRGLVSYTVDKPEKVGVGEMTASQINTSILSCEWQIQQQAQQLAQATRDNPKLCLELSKSLEHLEELLALKGNPITAGQKLQHIKARLEDQLALMPSQFTGFLRTTTNSNYTALQQMLVDQGQKVASLLMNPDHDFGSLAIPFEVEQPVRKVSETFHQQDMLEMRTRLDRDNTLVAPVQTRKDLQRQNFHCQNSNGERFDNAALRHRFGQVEASEQAEVLQQIEDGLLDFLRGLPVDQQMQVLSHVSQSEQNHMHYCLQGVLSEQFPLLGTLSQSERVEREIAVARADDNIEITYKMAFSPRFATELGLVDYVDPSQITMERKVVIAPGVEPTYLPMAVHMHLHQGTKVQ